MAKKTKKKKRIMGPSGMGAALAFDHKKSRVAVSNALCFKSNSLSANKIRQDAILIYGGEEVTLKN